MEANELQHGDWIRRRYTQSGREVVIDFQVDQLRRLSIDDNDLYVWGKNGYRGNVGTVEEMEPIPLTPEILEKNGFQADGYEILVFETDEYHFTLQKGVDGINNWWWDMFCSPVIPINYVHELQHALKLCKIEKEIEL